MVKQFKYAITAFDNLPKEIYSLDVQSRLHDICSLLIRLSINLNQEHTYPEITIEYKPVSEIKELVDFEETLYNKLTELGNLGLEHNNIQVVAFISPLICKFEHTFCKLECE